MGPIGGIEDKVVAAERAGAAVFLVPSDNMAELKGVDTGDMKLVSVSTFQEALDALASLGGQGIQSGATVRPAADVGRTTALSTACVRLATRDRDVASGRDGRPT